MQSPGPLVSLYNSVVDHVHEQLCCDSVRQLSWPTGTVKDIAIDWNETNHLSQIESQLSALRLPHPHIVERESDWSSQCVTSLQYVRSVCSRDSVILLSRYINLSLLPHLM